MIRRDSEVAMTLLEIIVVIVILGALAILSIPRLQTIIEKVRSHEGRDILVTVLGAQKRYFIDNESYTANMGDLDITISNPANFAPPIVSVNDPIVQIVRNGGLYTLSVNQDGTIICTDGTVTLCGKMGY